ncbi:olfactory receptor 14C36-like [Anser cygnoides]|uniref:olfactory receptor 14C36-like n=1 Tax=Anser cygnoides TaxID=8845 RepID=UPI0034D341FD
MGCISTTLPKAMANALWDTKVISYQGCAAQVFLFVFLMSAEYSLLTIMSYDRYVAICKPLHYGSLGRHKTFSTCLPHLAVVSLFVSTVMFAYIKPPSISSPSLDPLVAVLYSVVPPAVNPLIYSMRNKELKDILKLSCSDAYLREVGLTAIGFCIGIGCFVFIVLSYVLIFRAVRKIPSEQGLHKAFSTCLPHLAVVSLFVSTVLFAYLKPPSISSPSRDLVLSFLYSMLPPAVNPLIYSMRNQELKHALKKLFQLSSRSN